MKILLEVSGGDFLDRVSILEIKTERIADPAKRAAVETHLRTLRGTMADVIAAAEGVDGSYAELKAVNEMLWDIENAIRACDARGDFGGEFVRLARSVYVNNARRAAIKRAIDEAVGAGFAEEKEYARFGE